MKNAAWPPVPRRRHLWLWVALACLGLALVALAVGAIIQGSDSSRSLPASKVQSLPQARQAFEEAIGYYANPALEVDRVMEFAELLRSGQGEKYRIHALELLIDKDGGRVYPEPGPGMMWNAKYGMGGRGGMGGFRRDNNPSAMPITREGALQVAGEYLNRTAPGTRATDPIPFYGYYTLHAEKDGKVTGMLSVNGYGGEVWYHRWHGALVAQEAGR